MNISPEEAQASLVVIQQTRARTRALIGESGYFSIIWGLVWFFGCLGNQYLPFNWVWLAWTPTSLVGWILSVILGIHLGKQTRSQIGPRIAFFFLALFGYGLLWFVILHPSSFKQGVLFLLTLFIFGGTVVGIIQRVKPVLIGSLTMLALLVSGYYLVPDYFYLWTAIFIGLFMAVAGLVVRLCWR